MHKGSQTETGSCREDIWQKHESEVLPTDVSSEGNSMILKGDWSVEFILSLLYFLEKAMATHSSVLAWRIPGMVEPGGLPSMGSQRVGHDWSDLAAAAAALFSSFRVKTWVLWVELEESQTAAAAGPCFYLVTHCWRWAGLGSFHPVCFLRKAFASQPQKWWSFLWDPEDKQIGLLF